MTKSFMDPFSMMGGMMGEEKAPSIVVAPAPAAAPAVAPDSAPAPGPTAAEKAAAAEEEKKKKAKAAGGTILTGSLGVQDEPSTGKKTLLGT